MLKGIKRLTSNYVFDKYHTSPVLYAVLLDYTSMGSVLLLTLCTENLVIYAVTFTEVSRGYLILQKLRT